MQVIDLGELRRKRLGRIEQMSALIEKRRHNLCLTRRYLSMFGRCFSPSKLDRLQLHAAELERSTESMLRELTELRNRPLY